jgi:hypothetical protein
MEILDANDPDFAVKLAEAIGAKPGDTITFRGPQFERTDGLKVERPLFDFNVLPTLPTDTLKAIGCTPWDEPDKDGMVLWLLPYQWYDYIPEGYMLSDINGTDEPFKRGVTDNDMRYGVLAYGFKRKA